MSSIVTLLIGWRTWNRAASRRRALLAGTDLHAPRWRTLNRGWLLLLGVACAAGAVWLERLTAPLRAEAKDPLPTGYVWQASACPDDGSAPV